VFADCPIPSSPQIYSYQWLLKISEGSTGIDNLQKTRKKYLKKNANTCMKYMSVWIKTL
jgi:hypothetical protein